MRSRFLFGAVWFYFSLSAAVAQRRPGPAYFLRHPVTEPRPGLVLLPGGPVAALPAVAPLPTVRAAAASAPSPQTSQPLATAEPAPRRDLAGSQAYPPYDPYQNLPETFRKYTLAPAAPVPLQVLRSTLRR